MKQNNFKSIIGTATLCATLGLSSAVNAVVTAPVGYVQLTMNAESDTPFSLPMNRPMVYSGQASGISGNVISIANNDFVASEFEYEFTNDNDDSNDQRENYYVIFTTGELEGRKFDIISNTANSITIDPDFTEDNTALEDDLEDMISSATSNDNFQIRPHWTLNTLLPEGGVLPASPNPAQINGVILAYSTDLDGTNLSSSSTYAYVTSLGWFNSLNFGEGRVDDQILRSEFSYIFRNTSTEDIELNVMGDVPTVDQTLVFNQNVIQTDTFTGAQFPIDLSLDDLGLAGSDGFVSSTNPAQLDGGQVLVLSDNSINAAAEHVYVHVNGLGWIDSLDFGQGVITGDVIEAGQGIIIRSSAETEADTIFHSVNLPYNPFAE